MNSEKLSISLSSLDFVNEIEDYKFVLNTINSHFKFIDPKLFKVTIDIVSGIDIYSTPNEDIRVTISSDTNSNTIIRVKEYVKKSHLNYSEKVWENMAQVSSVFNKLFLYNNSDKRLFFSIDNNEKENLVFWISLSPIDAFKIYDFDEKYFPKKEIQNKLLEYGRMGVFDLIPLAELSKGQLLSYEYRHYILEDLLWNFNNLVSAIVPRESSGYKQELLHLLSITHNELTVSEWKENVGDNSLDISFRINSIFCEINNMPLDFSFQFVMKLNKFLEENFDRYFCQWNWERNPWEQLTFIYVKKSSFMRYLKKHREFYDLSTDVIEFYENN